MCSSPVMLGGGKHIENFGRSLDASARKSLSSSQRAYQPASTACGSNALGIWLSVRGRASSMGVAHDAGGWVAVSATEPARIRLRRTRLGSSWEGSYSRGTSAGGVVVDAAAHGLCKPDGCA